MSWLSPVQWAKWTWSAMKGAGEDELQEEDDVHNEEVEEDDEEEERNRSFRQVASHDSMTTYQQALGWAGLTLCVLLPAHTRTYTHTYTHTCHQEETRVWGFPSELFI